MATLLQKIQDDLKAAMKAKNQTELSALRLLKSDIQVELTAKGAAKELSEQDIEAIIKRAVKKRRSSIEEYEKVGRDEAAEQERAEIKVLEKYLPEELSREVIEKEIDAIIAQVKPEGPGDMGKVMGRVMGKFKGQNVDGALVNQLVRERLQKA